MITSSKIKSSIDDTDNISFYNLTSKKHIPDTPVVDTGFYNLSSKKHIPDKPVKEDIGLYSLTSVKYSSKSNFDTTGKNTFKLSNGESFTYNDLSFDKSEVKTYAPIEIIKGWWINRDDLKSHRDYIEQYNDALRAWEQEKDNPKSKLKKPSKNRHSVAEIDTEFTVLEMPLELGEIADIVTQENRNHLTTQVKFLPSRNSTAPNIIFASKNFARAFNPLLKAKGYQQLPVLTERDCDFFDYANLVTDVEWKVNYGVNDGYLNSLPKFFLTLSAHNAEAELNLIFHKQLLRRVKELQTKYSIDEGIEKRGKVVRCFSSITIFKRKVPVDWVSLKAIVTIDNQDFHLCLRIIDTIKCHGIVSLANFAKASGHKLETKDLLTKKDKNKIFETFLNKPEDSIAYSLGDTSNLEVQYTYYDQTGIIVNNLSEN